MIYSNKEDFEKAMNEFVEEKVKEFLDDNLVLVCLKTHTRPIGKY